MVFEHLAATLGGFAGATGDRLALAVGRIGARAKDDLRATAATAGAGTGLAALVNDDGGLQGASVSAGTRDE